MKHTFLFAAGWLLLATSSARAQQQLILSEDFTAYTGTPETVPDGWHVSWNSNSSSVKSYYSTVSNSGPSGANSYKFGNDGVFLITPYVKGADSLHFWMKGVSTDAASALVILHSADSMVWDTVEILSHVSLAGTQHATALPSAAGWIKFLYLKSAGNLAFDDVRITGTITSSVNFVVPEPGWKVVPNPATDRVKLILPEDLQEPLIRLLDLQGRVIMQRKKQGTGPEEFDISSVVPGVYFFQVIDKKRSFCVKFERLAN